MLINCTSLYVVWVLYRHESNDDGAPYCKTQMLWGRHLTVISSCCLRLGFLFSAPDLSVNPSAALLATSMIRFVHSYGMFVTLSSTLSHAKRQLL